MPDVLARILKVLRQLNQQLVVVLEEEDVVTKLFNDALKAHADLEPLQVGAAVHILEQENL